VERRRGLVSGLAAARKCEETAVNFLLTQFEPTLAKLNPQAPVKLISSALLELHERLSK